MLPCPCLQAQILCVNIWYPKSLSRTIIVNIYPAAARKMYPTTNMTPNRWFCSRKLPQAFQSATACVGWFLVCWCYLFAQTSVNATCVVNVQTEQLASGLFVMKLNWSVLFQRILHNNLLVHLEPFVLVCSSFVGCTTFHVVRNLLCNGVCH